MTTEQARFVYQIARYHRVIGGAVGMDAEVKAAVDRHDTSEAARLSGCMLVDIWLHDYPITNVASRWLELFSAHMVH